MVKVSVILTTFNSENQLGRTLDSILAQNGAGVEFTLELIVVDDCSTDRTPDILKAYNIGLYYTTATNSGGPNKGRNIGLAKATGDYICFIDHDDVWAPEKIRHQLKAAKSAPIVTAGYEVVNSATGRHTKNGDGLGAVKSFRKNETFLNKLSKQKQNIQHTYLSTIMIHKDLKTILFEEHFGMLDFDWTLRLFENQNSAEVSSILVSRFVHGSNLSLDAEYRKKDYYFSLMVLEAYEIRYPKEVSLAMKRLNGSRARYCYLVGEMPKARKYLLKSAPGVKEMVYYVTTFVGSKWVKKHFAVFG